jgi:prephenate dehydrogenase
MIPNGGIVHVGIIGAGHIGGGIARRLTLAGHEPGRRRDRGRRRRPVRSGQPIPPAPAY